MELPQIDSKCVFADNIRLGDSFIAGDVLLEVETDKATMDVEAQDDGKLAKITVYLHFLHHKHNAF